MSFGFSVGDFIAVGDLAFRLYRDCYQIARGAPQEFQLLVNEVSNLANSMQILQNEAKNPRSTLILAGDDRVRMVNDIVKGIGETLKRLEKVAKRYEILGSDSKGKHFWIKFKWSVEFSNIDGLRTKLVYHNTMMNLLLTSVGNSSLQRIETSNALLVKDLEAIKASIFSLQAAKISLAVSPAISMVDDSIFKERLSAALMKNAEVNQPWSTIGVTQWIESGRWWLLIAQMELFTVSAPRQNVPRVAYTNLIKASWILIDIIACHPQVPFLTASAQAEVLVLSAELRNEHSKIAHLEAMVPLLDELESQDLQIWEGQATESILRPHRDSRNTDRWKVAGGEQVLFHGYATCKLQVLSDGLPCILLFLVHQDTKSARMVAQSQNASIVMEISFHTPVMSVLIGCSLKVNGERITFVNTTDAETLEVCIQATNFYLHQRNVDHAELDDLKAYALIFAVKNNFHETFTQLSRTISSNGDHTNINTQRTPLVVAFSLASQPKGSKRDETNEQDYISAYTSTFFGWAVYHGHTALVALLLSERVIWDGALFEKADSDENRVGLLQRTLKYINKGNEETAQLLLDSFLKMVDRNECEFEALCESAKAGLDMVVRLLLRGTESLKHRKKRNGDNALQIAARNHRSIVVEECLKLGFDIDAKGRHEETPLMTAINSKSEQVVALLLDKGANANAKNVRGKRITHAALMSSLSEETVQQILAKAFEARSLKQSHSFQPKTKWRRADVNVDMDTSLKAGIFLDSYYAFFEAPQKFDCDVRDQNRRHIRLDQRQIRELSFQFGILFHPYPKPSLDISVRLYLEDDNRQYSRHEGRTFQGWKEKQKDEGLSFRIVNGGEFRIKLGDESQGLYHSFNDIATDPNAELVDSDKDASHWNMKCGRRKLLQ